MNAKQRILDIINRPDDILSESDISSINAILEAHDLVPVVKFPDVQIDLDNAELMRMRALETRVSLQMFDLVAHITHQQHWSQETFGPGERLEAILAHIVKEVEEVRESPRDLEEWVGVILLALDGARRQGYPATAICDALAAKQRKNEGRQWPDWRGHPTDQPIEHLRLPAWDDLLAEAAAITVFAEEQRGEQCAVCQRDDLNDLVRRLTERLSRVSTSARPDACEPRSFLQILRSECKKQADLVYHKPFRKCRRVDRRKMIRYVIDNSIALEHARLVARRMYNDRENPE